MKILKHLFGQPALVDAFSMPDNSSTLIDQLSKRKFWRDIDPRLLNQIAGNVAYLAQITGYDETKFLKSFVFVSECHDLVQNNFVPATRNTDWQDSPQILFAQALAHLGAGLSDVAASLNDPQMLQFVVLKADMAFTSAILCDPFQLPAYLGLASLYGTVAINKTVALKWCANYRRAEEKLLSVPDRDLAWTHRGQKALITNPSAARKVLDQVSTDPSDLESTPMREMIDALKRELLRLKRSFFRNDKK